MIKGILSWGKPRIFVKKLDASGTSTYEYRELPTPVDDSTTLETTEGDKTEAKIEGGEVEAVRYDRSTYKLSMQIRMKAGSEMPFANEDGLVNDNYELVVAPENPAAYGIRMVEANVAVKTSYSTNDGVMVDVSFDALKSGNSEQCEIGTVAVTGDGSTTPFGITFTPIAAATDKVV